MNKTIKEPGKFEGELYFIPELWNIVLDGFADDEHINREGDALIVIDDQLKEQYPELEHVKSVYLWESDQGFVCSTFNK